MGLRSWERNRRVKKNKTKKTCSSSLVLIEPGWLKALFLNCNLKQTIVSLSPYFVFFHRISGLAQGLSLQLVKLLLPLIHNDSFLVDPRSLSNATKELDVVFPVTYNERKSSSSVQISIVLCQLRKPQVIVLVLESSYLWYLCECGPSSAGQRRSCRATRGRCPLSTTPDRQSQTPCRSLSLGSLTGD